MVDSVCLRSLEEVSGEPLRKAELTESTSTTSLRRDLVNVQLKSIPSYQVVGLKFDGFQIELLTERIV